MLALRFVHFVGFTMWLAGLVATGLLLRARAPARIAAILADLGATLAIVSGIYTAGSYSLFNQPWLHIKLVIVAALLGVHAAMRVRVRRGDAAPAGKMVVTVGILALLILYVIIFKPMAR